MGKQKQHPSKELSTPKNKHGAGKGGGAPVLILVNGRQRLLGTLLLPPNSNLSGLVIVLICWLLVIWEGFQTKTTKRQNSKQVTLPQNNMEPDRKSL